MTQEKHSQKKRGKKKSMRFFSIIALEIITLLVLFGSYRIYIRTQIEEPKKTNTQEDKVPKEVKKPVEVITPEKQEAIAEQARLKKEIEERNNLILQADRLALGYHYDEAIELLQSYEGSEGKYQVYTSLTAAVERLKAEQKTLLLYGGAYDSINQIHHVFFHSLVADNSKAFDRDSDAKGYNMYMTTVLEFKNIIQKMYEDGYVLIQMADVAKNIMQEDGTTKYEMNEIYLREGKKPFVISVDDVNYYEYMDGDGFASRIVIGEDGKATCEMIVEDGTTVSGPFDIVPILDAFVEEHPDFSYQGAKGLLALTGYEGVLGYRTTNVESATYDEDREAVRKVVEALKANGWEFGSHSWGHLNMQKETITSLKRDTNRWLEEVGTLIGPTDIYVFPFGVDIETTLGLYNSDKYQFLKESGFNMFLGVYKEPWMHIKKDYIRMTRRPLDGQAMLQFPERLTDLFKVEEILDPERPPKNW